MNPPHRGFSLVSPSSGCAMSMPWIRMRTGPGSCWELGSCGGAQSVSPNMSDYVYIILFIMYIYIYIHNVKNDIIST